MDVLKSFVKNNQWISILFGGIASNSQVLEVLYRLRKLVIQKLEKTNTQFIQEREVPGLKNDIIKMIIYSV